jgi:hypothetical protein
MLEGFECTIIHTSLIQILFYESHSFDCSLGKYDDIRSNIIL